MEADKYDEVMLKVTEFLMDNHIEFECKWTRDKQLIFQIDFEPLETNRPSPVPA